MYPPRTPDELKTAFMGLFEPDTLRTAAIDELIMKIEAVYCGLAELTPIERLFGLGLFELLERKNA